ncbi:hypothetical protein FACS18945_5550 [Bacteroidia bacterium]|nr:hypothetical protein FACS18945_5550 [Bacteroidia bacterium]
MTEELKEIETPTEKISDADALAEMSDKYLRTLAELENTRRRAKSDIESAVRARSIAMAEKFLPLVDAINAALQHDPENEGLQVLSRATNGVLADVGISKIESVGQPLNPLYHNAISIVADGDAESNTIVDEMQTGYLFGDTVLRPAMVVVKK